MRNILLIITLFVTPLSAQITPENYREQVLDYSIDLKSARSQIEYYEEGVALTKKSRLPQLSASGDFRYLIRQQQGIKPTGILVEPTIVQTIYGGGSNIAQIEQAELSHQIAMCDEQFTLLEVEYAADYAYWSLWAMGRYMRAVDEYVGLIHKELSAIEYRVDEGYTTKGDLLMITSQLSEAEYQLTTIQQSYLVAQHNFNTLRGFDPQVEMSMEGIRPDTLNYALRAEIGEVIASRPDYQASRLDEKLNVAATRQIKGNYNPQLTGGVRGSWYTHAPNYDHSMTLDGLAYIQLSVPIFHFGERRRAVAQSKAKEQISINTTHSVEDQIVQEEVNAWTAIVTSYAQLDSAERSLNIATENLEISTYSYNEGLVSVVELMQAQASWIALYSNAIESHFNYQIALAQYRKVSAIK